MSLRRPCASDSRFSRRYPARKRTRKIFAISPGWNCNGPISIHSLTPLMRTPSPGTEGSISRTTADTPNR